MGSPTDPSEGWQPPSAPPPPPPPPGTPPPAAPYTGYQQPYAGYQQPAPGYPYATPTTEGTAIAALILAIASFFVCLPTSIIALPLASSAKKKIAASNGMLTGENLLTPARVIAWINIGLWAVGILGFIALIVLGAVFGNTSTSDQQPFQRLLEVVPSGL